MKDSPKGAKGQKRGRGPEPIEEEGVGRVGTLNMNGWSTAKAGELADLLNKKNQYDQLPTLHVCVITETHLTEESIIDDIPGWVLVARADDPRPGRGGVAIFARKAWEGFVFQNHPHERTAQGTRTRPNLAWVSVVTPHGTAVVGGVYSGPNDLQAHIELMADVASDYEAIISNKDVATVALLGDLNTRLGNIVGDTKEGQANPSRDYAPPLLDLLDATGMSVGTAKDNARAHTCFRHNGRSVNDYCLVSHDLRGDYGRDLGQPMMTSLARGVRISPHAVEAHQQVHLGSDHCLVTSHLSIECPAETSFWGSPPSKTKFDWSEEAKETYKTKLTTCPRIRAWISETTTLARQIRSTQHRHPASPVSPSDRAQTDVLTEEIRRLIHLTAVECAGERGPDQEPGDSPPEGRQTEPRGHRQSPRVVSARKKRDRIVAKLRADPPPAADETARARSKLAEVNHEISRLLQAAIDRKEEGLWKKVNKIMDDPRAEKMWWRLTKRMRTENLPPFPTVVVTHTGQVIADPDGIMGHIGEALLRVTESKDEPAREFAQRMTPASRTKRAEYLAECHRKMRAAYDEGNMDDAPSSAELTRQEVQDALDRLNVNTQGVPNELLPAMFRFGGETMTDIMTALLSLFWTTTNTPASLQAALMVLLYKKGNRADPASYRPITLADVMAKIWESILLKRTMSCLNDSPLGIHADQGACKEKTGSLDTVAAALDALCSLPEWVLVAYDLSKAFDRCPRVVLFSKLREKGVKGRLWRSLVSTYSNSTVRIRIGAIKSMALQFLNSIKQGSVLSPVLFVIFVDDLLVELETIRAAGMAQCPGTAKMFVDDLAAINATIDAVKRSHEAIIDWCERNGCVVNMSKMEVLHHGASTQPVHEFVMAAGADPGSVCTTSLKYLGVVIQGPAGRPEMWDQHTVERCKKARATFYMMSKRGLSWGGGGIPTGLRFIQTIVLKRLLYGDILWQWTDNQIDKVNHLMVSILKPLLGLHVRTPTLWVLWETGNLPADIAIDAAKLVAWRAWKSKWSSPGGVPCRYVVERTNEVFARWGFVSPKYMRADYTYPKGSTKFRELALKQGWAKLVRRWSARRFRQRIVEWDATTRDAFPGHPSPMEIKPNWGDETKHISKLLAKAGKSLPVLMRARANTLGFGADRTANAPPGTTETMCPVCFHHTHVSDTAAHAALECPSRPGSQSPPDRDPEEWARDLEEGGDEVAATIMVRVLRAEDAAVSKWAMENIRSGLAHRDRAFYRRPGD